ncbi:hypothetical protein GUITHDRAFT_101953 [Guillardia theta CCMP2712]|uniref:Uncharacterized protein n=1 Tax=Guillardia theta (strain CCMP2712) TaxID=905079 RepID=L1JV09_GUITC|nr:hypothetical protein GUITHDRAFT_101953 [Guillardia theta CCMP2712]EKX52045.1 hypothetical protein GUITHDRAFT_101953 [Guillardia theta CCMP2712]|eukprot:XP_005839025.1 hypothetical protein GUITHDRAFT_101953 [Guillardia theta CCMP2712]
MVSLYYQEDTLSCGMCQPCDKFLKDGSFREESPLHDSPKRVSLKFPRPTELNSNQENVKNTQPLDSSISRDPLFVQGRTKVMEVSDGRHFVRYVGGPHEGDSYDGFFRNGVKHGPGIYTWASGDKFEGEYVDDFKHGGREFR